MTIWQLEQVEQKLLDAGFSVEVTGISFIVRLYNRAVSAMEVLAVLDHAENVLCVQSNRSVVVFVN